MQVTCSICLGQCYVYDREGDREDVCYHCAGLGTVEPEVDRHDRLMQVAGALAYRAESEYRKACDTDPEGEGYEFAAAEHMMVAHDYFNARVSDRQYHFSQKLEALDSVLQDALLEWHAQPRTVLKQVPSPNEAMPSSEPDTLQSAGVPPLIDSKQFNMSEVFGEDNIPF